MSKKIKLVFENEETKQVYFNALRDKVLIPVCKNCGKLFSLGFPNNDDGMCDYLICQENYLLCECEYFKMVRNLYSQDGEMLVDITPYYTVKR